MDRVLENDNDMNGRNLKQLKENFTVALYS